MATVIKLTFRVLALRHRPDERLTLEKSALLWPTHIINTDDETKLSCYTPNTVSVENYPLLPISLVSLAMVFCVEC